MQTRFTPEYIEQLGHGFRQGTLSAEEQADFDTWYTLQTSKELDLSESSIKDADQLGNRIYGNILARLDIRPAEPVKKTYRLWIRICAAAAVLIAIFSSLLFYYANDEGPKDNIVLKNDVSPGRTGATLTLASGQKIVIGQAKTGKIATQSGVGITKMPDGQINYELSQSKSGPVEYNILSTSRGQQTNVRLPDGSVVFLNAASSLRYPASFADLNSRTVELSGEGYFEVAKDKDHPFIVKTSLQKVEVLGTHFNINSYTEELAQKTSLLEGSIKISSGKESKVLRPGEQAELKNNKIQTGKVDTEEIVAWKNNEFLFKDDDFRTNMRKIARWYDLEVIYEPDAPDNIRLGGFLSRTRNLSAVLRLLENTDKVHFRIEGKKLYVGK
ncbi:FecR family protein [Pedobacter mucosus]|uniref:FecR family protein n=1 Tax=Pedobacter mucosus TaxID=2895286 RepID=UPI001EE43557|nr:FecR domain-containing protein [Pedobacter mucosus]UKT64999.1 FecR domain-containing protein [Pedobacter mucosus]